MSRDDRHALGDEPINRGLAIDNSASPTGPFTVSEEVRKQQEALMAEYSSPIRGTDALPRPTTITAPPPYGNPRTRYTYTPLGERIANQLEEVCFFFGLSVVLVANAVNYFRWVITVMITLAYLKLFMSILVMRQTCPTTK